MSTMDFSHLASSDSAYIDSLYQQYKEKPESLEQSWVHFFKGFEFAVENNLVNDGAESFGGDFEQAIDREFKIFRLIQSYRARGHLLSKTNPIRERKDRSPRLNLQDYKLSEQDLDQPTICGQYLGLGSVTLRQIIEHMSRVYCSSIGVEYMHINDTEIRRWFRDRFEKDSGRYNFPLEKKKRILQKLNEAVVFESFLNTKYVGQKRFSIEGGENTIPALDALINKAAENGTKEVVLGMAHRGRLNVLANIMGKTYEYIFNEFEGQAKPDLSFGDGDVKYHLGFSSEVKTASGNDIYLKLMPNPSHLEAVGPVVLGYTRSQGDQLYDSDREKVLPVLIHGDAALAGQGVVYESIQLSQLKGYSTGGTIHFVINNQIGFTTDFDDARSSHYSTSVARVLNVPAIHVNGDDAEAVVYAVELAAEFRQKFKQDIFVDMVCYRKHGHNEGDEPRFTQPNLYKKINGHPNPREIYLSQLIEGKSLEAQLAQNMEEKFKSLLQDRFNLVKQKPLAYQYQKPEERWAKMTQSKAKDFEKSPETGVTKKKLETILKALTTIPENLKPIRKAQKILDERKKRWQQGTLDWALAELLAYGSLLLEKHNVRMSGQDCIRGTFSHRHAGIMDENGNESYLNLNHINEKQAQFRIYNSPLSEYAVLGFEYGYSLGDPMHLNIWEAQFGDFANGAQTVFDQFLSSAESKWQKQSGMMIFLPHGYEGQGPEHSNARPERFLQLASEHNMIVANCTTPANLFHLIRRQLAWNFRKPTILMTPKSLLRHPQCISEVSELIKGGFQELILDPLLNSKKKMKRLIFCSGKIYYDLLQYRQEKKINDIAILRLEQLYPLPEKQIQQICKKHSSAQLYWVQEEPKNMGAWTYLLRYDWFRDFQLISRKSSASPATGYASVHKDEQEKIMKESFNLK